MFVAIPLCYERTVRRRNEVASLGTKFHESITRPGTGAQALKEWAMASSEAKQLKQDWCHILETKLKQQQALIKNGGSLDKDDSISNGECILFKSKGSKVIGAGETAHTVVKLGEHAMKILHLATEIRLDARRLDH